MAKANANTQDPKADGAETATVMEVAITDGEDQTVVSEGPIGEPKGKQRGTRGKQAVSGAESASAASKPRATPESKTPGKRATARVGTQKSPKGGKAQGTRGKARKSSAESKSAREVKGAPKKPASTITMAELADSYLRHLESQGKSAGTTNSYGIELRTAVKHFGADRKLAGLSVKDVESYFTSDRVTKKRSGEPKSGVGVAKTRRVLRLALVWLAEVGVLKTAPIPTGGKKPDKSGS